MSTNTARKEEMNTSTLMDSLTAVSAALSEMPDSAFKTSSPLAEAFLQTDPVLSNLNRQRLDAIQHYNTLVRANGFNDAMVEAVAFQRAQIEEAYKNRLGALRRRQGEQKGRQTSVANDDELNKGQNRRREDQRLRQIKREEEDRLLQEQLLGNQVHKRSNAIMWSLIGFALGFNQSAYYQQRLAPRPV